MPNIQHAYFFGPQNTYLCRKPSETCVVVSLNKGTPTLTINITILVIGTPKEVTSHLGKLHLGKAPYGHMATWILGQQAALSLPSR